MQFCTERTEYSECARPSGSAGKNGRKQESTEKNGNQRRAILRAPRRKLRTRVPIKTRFLHAGFVTASIKQYFLLQLIALTAVDQTQNRFIGIDVGRYDFPHHQRTIPRTVFRYKFTFKVRYCICKQRNISFFSGDKM